MKSLRFAVPWKVGGPKPDMAMRTPLHGDAMINMPDHPLHHNTSQHGTPGSAFPSSSPQIFYSSLPLNPGSNCVRVLILDDSDASATSLSGELRVVHLQPSLSFTALSYVWGEKASPAHSLSCRASGAGPPCRLEITANCFAALLHIRRRFGPMPVWVDSVCINQADEAEKEGQIAIMQDIYTLADAVYVWLGEGSAASNKAIQYFTNEAVRKRRLPLAWLASTSKDVQQRRRREWRARAFGDVYSRLRWAPVEVTKAELENLLDREWVHRAWTFQELILAYNPVILCGDKVLLWEDFVTVMHGGSLDVAPEIYSNWRSVVDLWFELPRPSLVSYVDDIERGSRTPSLAYVTGAHIDGLYRGLPRSLLLIFCSIYISLRVLWIPVWFAFVLSFYFRIGIKTWDIARRAVYLAFTSLAVILSAFIINKLLINRLFKSATGQNQRETFPRLPTHTGAGGESDDTRGRSSQTNSSVIGKLSLLDGIRNSLRERISSRAHDKCFSLAGILRVYGASPSTADYGQTLVATCQNFLQDLTAWQPSAMFLLADASWSDDPFRPSWVPVWQQPLPNAWLTSQLRMGTHHSNASPIPRGPSFKFNGDELTIRGRYIGTVCFRTEFEEIVEDIDGVAFILALHYFLQWIYIADLEAATGKGQTLAGRQRCPSSILEGRISWDENSAESKLSGYDDLYNVLNILRDRIPNSISNNGWLFPFTPSKKGKQVIRGAFNPNGSNMDFDIISTAVRNNERAFSYFRSVTNKMITDRRCLVVLSTGWLGTAPTEIRTGDVALLFEWVPSPIIVRRSQAQNKYRVVGPTIVYGMKHKKELRPGKLEDIILI